DNPTEHPAVNEAERELIARGSVARPESSKGVEQTTSTPFEDSGRATVPWGRVLRNANVWLLGGVITCSACGTYLYFLWYPTYLEKGRGVDGIRAGWLSGLVLGGGAV